MPTHADAEDLEAVKKDWEALKDLSQQQKNNPTIVKLAVEQDGQALKFASGELKRDRAIVLVAVSQRGHAWRALSYASPEMKQDREVVTAAVQHNGSALQFAAPVFKGDRDVVLEAVAQNGDALKHASEQLRADRDVVLRAVEQKGDALKHASKQLWADREVVLEAVAQHGSALKYASEELRGDRGVVWKACSRALKYTSDELFAFDGSVLEHASDELKRDRDFMMEAVKQDCSSLEFASEELRGDRDVVLEAVKQYGFALEYASEELQGDCDFMLEALAQSGSALKYASEELQGDRDLVLEAVKQDGYALGYASEELRGDRDVVLEAVKQYGFALEYASEELQGDRDVVLEAVKRSGSALEYASKQLWGDRDLVLGAVKENSSLLELASEQLQGDREFMLAVVEHLIRRTPDDGSGDVDYVGTKKGMLAACQFLSLDKKGNKPDLAARLKEWYEREAAPKRKKQKTDGGLAEPVASTSGGKAAESGGEAAEGGEESESGGEGGSNSGGEDMEVEQQAAAAAQTVDLSWLELLPPTHLKPLCKEKGLGESGNREALARRLRANDGLSKAQLKVLCKKVGVTKQGNMADLAQRIGDKLRFKAEAKKAKAVGGGAGSASPFRTMSRDEMDATHECLFGSSPGSNTDDDELRSQLLEFVKPHADGWEAALAAALHTAVSNFLTSCGRTNADAERVASARLQSCSTAAAQRAMWAKLSSEYCPRAPAPPDRSSAGKVLVIAPGFGIMATPAQLRTLQRAYGSAVICSNQHANPEEADFDMAAGIPPILQEIKDHKPEAILCASKGGLYMRELWRLMEAGDHDHLKGIAYLMINAPPDLTQLPQGVKIILVQGAKEEKWPRLRGYLNNGRVADGSLEALIRTGSPGMCYLYYTAEVKSNWGYRKGDTHVPVSLLQHDCLPRLVDSLLATSSSPGAAFQASSRAFVSAKRMAAENGLGWHPDTLASRFVGPELRVEVLPGSDEFKNVEAIFKADPASGVDRFYFKDTGVDHFTITKIERVQNRSLKDSVDDKRGRVKKMIESDPPGGFGEQYVAGVHSRWLFHGASTADVLDNIISDPVQGFAPQMARINLWGYGSYFARDASYSIHGHYCDDCRDDEEDRMILLCLVECGLSCVGEGGAGGQEPMKIMPKVHPQRKQLKYMSYVDYAANPEIFVTMGEQAYPAYIIHFDD